MAKKPSRLSRHVHISKLGVLVVALGMVIFGYIVVRIFAAGPASLYFSPASGSYSGGSSLTVAVYTNTGGQSSNAVQADFSYDSSRLTYVSTDFTGSAYSITASSSGGGGTVSMVRGNVSPVSGVALIGTVHFNVLSNAGTAALSFQNSSAVASSADNSNILGSTTGANFTVVVSGGGTPTPTPTPTSTPVTHTPTPTPVTGNKSTPKPTSTPTTSSNTSPTPTPSTVVIASPSKTPGPVAIATTPSPTDTPGPVASPVPTAGTLQGLADAASRLLGGHVTVAGAAGAAIPLVLLVVVVVWLLWRRANSGLKDSNPSHFAPPTTPSSSEPTHVTGAPPTGASAPSKIFLPGESSESPASPPATSTPEPGPDDHAG
jgi:hypothetical protein